MNVLLYYSPDWKKPEVKIETHDHEFQSIHGSLLKLCKSPELDKFQFIFLIGFKEEQKTIKKEVMPYDVYCEYNVKKQIIPKFQAYQYIQNDDEE